MFNSEERIYVDKLSLLSKFHRQIWILVYVLFFRFTPKVGFNRWRIFILRLFGAKIGIGCKIDPTCKIWAPWNLVLEDFICIAEQCDIYTVDKIYIESNVTISQRSFICTASHELNTLRRELNHKPILIKKNAWVAAEAFVGPGVTLGEGSIVAARGVVFKDVEAWTVVGGNPAKIIKKRVLKPE